MKLDEIRLRLQEERAQLQGAAAENEREDDRDSGREVSDMPTHHADAAPENEVEQLVAGLSTDFSNRIAQIDAALQRIEDGTYGTCVSCGRPIGEERLDARPDADRCIDCETRAERSDVYDDTARRAR
jgi:DnaK suppressor protein